MCNRLQKYTVNCKRLRVATKSISMTTTYSYTPRQKDNSGVLSLISQ